METKRTEKQVYRAGWIKFADGFYLHDVVFYIDGHFVVVLHSDDHYPRFYNVSVIECIDSVHPVPASPEELFDDETFLIEWSE